jgi:uncharacterized DUF497 family protein
LYILSATLALVSVSGFDWDDDNVLHIDRRQFSPDEVEEVFAGDYKVRRTRQKLYIALGETLDGRLAFVVFRRLPDGLIRVVTAGDMDKGSGACFAPINHFSLGMLPASRNLTAVKVVNAFGISSTLAST